MRLLPIAALCAASALLPAQPAVAQTAAPFVVTVQPTSITSAPALQSFAFAQSHGSWLLIGGRTNGFHRTSTKEATFPIKMANDKIYVVDPVLNQTSSIDIPKPFLYQLRSTNMEFYQDGDILYLIGGYGSDCDTDDPTCYVTFGNIIALHVGDAMAAVKSASAEALARSFFTLSTTNDPRFQVTGGALSKLGDYFYLVMGQNFKGIYKGGSTGIYTQVVKRFKMSLTTTGLVVTDYQEFPDPFPPSTGSRLHRRDLNIVEEILPSGKRGLAALGGVFTANGSAWQGPIYIYEIYEGLPASSPVHIGLNFSQKLNLYDCAHFSLFDANAHISYAILMGGISLYYFNSAGQVVLGTGVDFMPFINSIDVVSINLDGQMNEYPQSPTLGSLPSMLGTDAIFIPLPALPSSKGKRAVIRSNAILPISSWPSTPTLIGYMYGGIQTNDSQVSFVNPSVASSAVYGVYLQSTDAAGKALQRKKTVSKATP